MNSPLQKKNNPRRKAGPLAALGMLTGGAPTTSDLHILCILSASRHPQRLITITSEANYGHLIPPRCRAIPAR